jgi:hypothetical protein
MVVDRDKASEGMLALNFLDVRAQNQKGVMLADSRTLGCLKS